MLPLSRCSLVYGVVSLVLRLWLTFAYVYEAATANPQAGSRNVWGRSTKEPVSGRQATISVRVYRTQATMPPAII